MLKECSSGTKTSDLGEMKERRLTLAKWLLYKSDFHVKLLKGPNMLLLEV